MPVGCPPAGGLPLWRAATSAFSNADSSSVSCCTVGLSQQGRHHTFARHSAYVVCTRSTHKAEAALDSFNAGRGGY